MGEVRPIRGPIDRVISVPGSKSLANRALVIAGLAGRSNLYNVPDGDDCVAMIDALRALGAEVSVGDSEVSVGRPVDRDRDRQVVVNARLAGTTSRFLLGLCSLIVGPTTVTGEDALTRRPMQDLLDALVSLGANVSSTQGRLPVTVSRGSLSGGRLSVRADVSSQFISSLMLVGPSLAGGLRIEMSGSTVSASYIGLTADVMRHFGCDVSLDSSTIAIGEGSYRSSRFDVPPDASSASYPLLLVALHGGKVRIPDLGRASNQGDFRFLSILESTGCSVRLDADDVIVERDPSRTLSAIDVDMRDCSDLVPTVAVLATQLSGRTTIRGVGFVRGKESDRIGDLAAELCALGAHARTTEDGLEIDGSSLHGGLVRTHHDHRLAMAFGVLGTLIGGVRVDDEGVVSKSWPNFWTDMEIATSS